MSPKVANQRCVFSPEAQFVCKVFLKEVYYVLSDLIEAAVNAPGGKHPILYCTWRKNPEERRVQHRLTLIRGKPGRCLQHSIERGRHQELQALTSGGGVLLSWTGNGGSLSESDVLTVKRNTSQGSFYLNN